MKILSNKELVSAFYRDYQIKTEAGPLASLALREKYQAVLIPILKLMEDCPTLEVGGEPDVWPEGGVVGEYSLTFVEDWVAQGQSSHFGNINAYLASCADETYAAIIFHRVVEKLPLHIVLVLLENAFRALKPGGVVLLESINPENFSVASQLLGSNQAVLVPLLPDLTVFALNRVGFTKVKAFGVPENRYLPPDFNALSADSGVYLAIAQVPGNKKVQTAFNKVIGQLSGLNSKPSEVIDTENLGRDRAGSQEALSLRTALLAFQSENHRLQSCLADSLEHEAQHKELINSLRGDRHAVQVSFDALLKGFEDRGYRADQILNSTSWKLTYPVRLLMKFVRSPIKFMIGLIATLDKFSSRKPALRRSLIHVGKLMGLSRNSLKYEANVPTLAPSEEDAIWSIAPPHDALRQWESALRRNR